MCVYTCIRYLRIWYGFAYLIAVYLALFGISILIVNNVRAEANPPPPIVADDDASNDVKPTDIVVKSHELPFEPVSFAFKVSIVFVLFGTAILLPYTDC